MGVGFLLWPQESAECPELTSAAPRYKKERKQASKQERKKERSKGNRGIVFMPFACSVALSHSLSGSNGHEGNACS